MGGRETRPEQVKAPKKLAGVREALRLLPSIRPNSEVVLAAGCQVWGAAVLHGSSLAPGSFPAISAAALHPLCFVRAAQVAASGQGFQHRPPPRGGSVINVKCPLSPFPLHLLQYLQFLLLKTHTSLTL